MVKSKKEYQLRKQQLYCERKQKFYAEVASKNPNRKRLALSDDEYERRIALVRARGGGGMKHCAAFRSSFDYTITDSHIIRESKDGTGAIQLTLLKNINFGKKNAAECFREVERFDRVFFIIRKYHSDGGHRGADATKKEIDKRYCNISEKDVEIYIRGCIWCKNRNRNRNPKKPKRSDHDAAAAALLSMKPGCLVNSPTNENNKLAADDLRAIIKEENWESTPLFDRLIKSTKDNGETLQQHQRRIRVGVRHALLHQRYTIEKSDWGRYRYISCDINCRCCCFKGSLVLFDDAYFSHLLVRNTWWSTNFIQSWARLLCHEMHVPDLCYISCQFPSAENISRAVVNNQPGGKKGEVKVVSAVCAEEHYAVIVLDRGSRCAVVTEGLQYNLELWRPHVTYLRRTMGWDEGEATDNYWSIYRDERWRNQLDGHNCGPLACWKLWQLYDPAGFLHDRKLEEDTDRIRGIIVSEYKLLMTRHLNAMTTSMKVVVDDLTDDS